MKWYQKKYFFGWSNWKMLIIELLKIGSDKPGVFSQKRIHQGIAFGVLQWGMIYWLTKRISNTEMDTAEFIMWCGVELLICGYTINQIQKEKFKINGSNSDKPTSELEKTD